jgi:outer membrane protein
MKKLFLALAILLSTTVFGQVKLGHINTGELVQMMPGLAEANSNLEKYQGSLEEQLKIMYGEYEALIKDYQTREKYLTEVEKEVKQKTIVSKETLIKEYEQSAQEKVTAKREELFTPLLKKAEQAIKDVAKEKNYAYIFDTSAGGAVIYAQDSDNIMELVKAKLGILATATPASNSNTPATELPKKQ